MHTSIHKLTNIQTHAYSHIHMHAVQILNCYKAGFFLKGGSLHLKHVAKESIFCTGCLLVPFKITADLLDMLRLNMVGRVSLKSDHLLYRI